MKNICITLTLFFLFTSASLASTYDGTVRMLRSSTGNTPARMSVLVGLHNSPCGGVDWFAYENADTGLGKIWTAKLMLAKLEGLTVFIQGKGTCTLDIEEVQFIDLK